MNAFREMFFAECEDLLLRAGTLLDTPRADWPLEDLAELHRCIHSIKGGAVTFGLESLSELAREAEKLLDGLRTGRLLPDGPRLALIREVVQQLGECLQRCREGGGEPPTEGQPELVQRLRASGGGGDDALGPASVHAGAPEADSVPAGEDAALPVLGFDVAGQGYAIDARRVREIRSEKWMARLPGAPAPLAGVTELGGEYVPVVDLRSLLTAWRDPEGSTRAGMLLCLELANGQAALLVDHGGEIVALDTGRVGATPAFVIASGIDYVEGFIREHDGIRILLDVEVLLQRVGVGCRNDESRSVQARIEALNARLSAIRATHPRLPQNTSIGARIDAVQGRLDRMIGHALDRTLAPRAVGADDGAVDSRGQERLNGLLDYAGDAVDAGRAAIQCQRDGNAALSYAERSRETLLLLLEWVADLVSGLERYMPDDEQRANRAGASRATNGFTEAMPQEAGKEPSGPDGGTPDRSRPPLPKIRRGIRQGAVAADEWEIFRE